MLFLSDLDFTLLRSDTTLSTYTKEVWNRTAKRHKLSIATARSYTGVSKLLQGLDLREPMILLDGTIIAKASGEILYMADIGRELGDEILSLAKKELGIEPLIVAQVGDKEHFFYPKELNVYQQELIKSMEMRQRVFVDGALRAKEHNLKIVFQANEADSLALEQTLKSAFGSEIEIKRSNDPYYDCYFITILNPKGDKAHALKKLEEIESVTAQNTTVFGDSHNDLGLFEVAGTKIAVANAIKELKEKADIVLPHTNDEDAVAKYLDKTVLSI